MPQLTPITKQNHSEKSWTRFTSYTFASKDNLAPLAEADVISEWPLKIQDGDQEKSVTGLYRIDEEKLNTLEDEKFLKIRKAGALPIAYAQLFSMGNIQNFLQLAKTHEQLKTKTPDIQPILGDDDIISFQ